MLVPHSTLVSALICSVPQPHWAIVTASFVIAEGGSSLPVCIQRVKGTLYGAAWALLISSYVLIGFEDGSCETDPTDCWRNTYAHKVTLVFMTVPFQLCVGLFTGYDMATASLTSPLIITIAVGKVYTVRIGTHWLVRVAVSQSASQSQPPQRHCPRRTQHTRSALVPATRV